MKLTYTNLCDIVYGAEKVIVEKDDVVFHRFTEKEMNAYRKCKNDILNKRTESSAGIRLSFVTDSENLKICCRMMPTTDREYGFFDVYEDGALLGHKGTDNINGDVEKEFKLTRGKKHVEVYFPWSVNVRLYGVELDDGALIEKVSRKKKMISYGDSITQGYDARYPSLAYSNQIAKLLDADVINKAVGGDVFFPELVEAAEERAVDYVTVAYGTNDWSGCKYDEFVKNCTKFIKNIEDKYKEAKIYVITPIWRADGNMDVPMGIVNSEVGNIIRKICHEYENITVINGKSLVPHDTSLYSDERLHPNDLGFSLYAKNLYTAILNSEK